MKSIIEEQCAAYIQDKADALGIPCTVEVQAEELEGGLSRVYTASCPP